MNVVNEFHAKFMSRKRISKLQNVFLHYRRMLVDECLNSKEAVYFISSILILI